MKRVRTIGNRLWSSWMYAQVEFQGSYSVNRLQNLNNYMQNVTNCRLAAVCLLTPLPCLVLSIINELPPLAPPDDGVYANWVFWIRAWAGTTFIYVALILQLGQYAPRLKMKTRQILFTGLMAASVSTAVGFAATLATVFPLPFGMVLVGLPGDIVLFACGTYFWGEQWRSDALLRKDIKRIGNLTQCQTLLTLVYPLYVYGFVSVRGTDKALFVLVLPVIKLVGKNWVSRLLGEFDDMKPETIIFNVELFNALYVSCAIQKASSIPTTITIILMDLVYFGVTMIDVVELLNEVKSLMSKIPRAHPVASENFVQIAQRLLTINDQATVNENTSMERQARFKSMPTLQPSVNVPTGGKRAVGRKSQVFPICPPSFHPPLQSKRHADRKTQEHSEVMAKVDTVPLEAIFSRAERLVIIRKTMSVLFVTEYLVLVEYMEAFLPIIYSLNRVVLAALPNSAYYSSLAGLSHAELVSTILNVLLYGAFEFASLAVAVIVLKHTLGFSSWCQLAFVLDTQASMVQTKLTVWFMYIMQISLVHLGADFSFKFAWVRKAYSNS